MFTKFKQAIEKWLRGLIADEVSPLNTSLNSERQAMCNLIGSAGATLNTSLVKIEEIILREQRRPLRQAERTLKL